MIIIEVFLNRAMFSNYKSLNTHRISNVSKKKSAKAQTPSIHISYIKSIENLIIYPNAR